jgi:thioredoxin reductase (NADPH)
MEHWELVIVGGGAAGLAAGIYGARSGLKTLVLDEKLVGGTTADAPIVENYPGFMQITGAELASKFSVHCKRAGAFIRELESVVNLHFEGSRRIVTSNRAEYEAGAVVIASGSHYRELGVPGEKEFKGRGVSYCGVCDGPLFKGKTVLVAGGGNSALITASYLSGIASVVYLVHRRDSFRAEEVLVKDVLSKGNVHVLMETEVKEIKGEKVVNSVLLYDRRSSETRELPVNAVFVQAGEVPNSQLAKQSGVEVDEEGYIKVDIRQRTNVPGVYAAGDVTNHPVKQIGTAVGQGITAVLEAYRYIKQPYYRK